MNPCGKIFVLGAWALLASCGNVKIEEGTLESSSLNDPSLADPGAYLISVHDSVDNDSLKALPTVVAFHGFSASTYEWWEFRDFCDSLGKVRVSLPLLGGHGRDYEDFRKATWRDWQAGPLAEYQALSERGYRNLDIVCSSTGCPLLIEAMERGWFEGKESPRHVVMIDPIIFSSDKALSLVDIASLFINNVQGTCSDIEKSYWYCDRPEEALSQLMELLTKVRKQLEDGVQAPDSTSIVLHKSKRDASADPVSAIAIYQGLRNGDGSRIQVVMENSSLHVFTRLAGRNSWTAQDAALQIRTFVAMDSLFSAP